MPSTDRPWLVMIAGPYMSAPAETRRRSPPTARGSRRWRWPIYERGHLPLIGEWLALPIIHAAGGMEHGDSVFEAYQYPVARRLLERCDALLRLPGASRGADMDVERARALGLPVVTSVDELPMREAA